MSLLLLATPDRLAVAASALYLVAGGWVCVIAAEFVNQRSTVGPSVSGGSAALPGAGRRAVEREDPQHPSLDGPNPET